MRKRMGWGVSACSQFEEKQDVERLQGDRLHGEEIAGQHLCPVVVQKGPPRAAPALRGRQQMVPAHHVGHRAWIQRVTQLEQLAVDLVIAHPWIFPRQSHNQPFQTSLQPRASAWVGLPERPLATYEVAMPLEKGLRLNKNQTCPHLLMQRSTSGFEFACQGDQHELLWQAQPMLPLALALQDAQLLAQ